MSSSYLTLLESLRLRYKLAAFPDPLPSTQFHLKLEKGLTLTIDCHEKTNMVELFSTIGTFAAKDELEVLRNIVQGNFFWAATAGGTLSARLDKREVYLAYQIPLSTLSNEEFITLVEKFAQIAQEWETILKVIGNEAATVKIT